MSKGPISEVLAYVNLDPDHQEEDSNKQRFNEEIRRTVNPLISGYESADIRKMSTEEWTELRNALLSIKITLMPNGDIIHD